MKDSTKNYWVDAVLKGVSLAYGVPVDWILDEERTKARITARVAVVLMLRDMGFGLTDIGKLLGRHHTTIHNAINRGEKLLKSSPDFGKKLVLAQKFAEAVFETETSEVHRNLVLKKHIEILRKIGYRLLDMLEGTEPVSQQAIEQARKVLDRDPSS